MDIIFEKNDRKSYAIDNCKKVGYCEYEDLGDIWNITHTVVNPDYRGMKLAQKLLDEVVAHARIANVKLTADCSYAVKKFKEDIYKDVLA